MKKLIIISSVFFMLFFVFSTFASSEKVQKDVGYGSGGDFYQVEYEENLDKATFSIIVTAQDKSQNIMRIFSKEKKRTVKQLYENPSTANDLLLVFGIYSELCTVEKDDEFATVYLLDLDNF